MNFSEIKYFACYLFIASVFYHTDGATKKKDILKSSLELLEKEAARLSNKKDSCGLKSIATAKLDNLRISKQIDKAIACHIEALQNNKEDGWLWSSLGDLYLHSSNVPKSSSLATSCFKQAVKLSGKLSSYVALWHFLGPFVIGKIEVDGDPTEAFGGIVNASRERYNKKFKAFSEYVTDGAIGWSSYRVNSALEPVRIVPQVNWNDLINSLGSIAITEWQGWTVGEIAVNDNNQNVLIQCLGVHTIYIDDSLTPVTGDVYRRNHFWFSVSLDKGIHTVYIKQRTKQAQLFQCTFTIASSTYEILKPHFLPDLYDGYLFSNRIAIPISNYHSTKWLKISKISIASQSDGKPLRIERFPEEVAIAPGQVLPVTVVLRTESDEDSEVQLIERCEGAKAIHLSLRVNSNEGQQHFSLDLGCRVRHESFLLTFPDHDGSVQHAAAVEPIAECQESECQRSVLLTLHGTTVPPQNQADSYKHMVNGKFVFGLQKAWTLAPTRHGAHNWEGPGALTALTALDFLGDRTKSAPWIKSKANTDYVIFAGHSMGGHGAWHLATHFPDKALAVVALAGWNRKEDYGDSNLLFRHDIAVSSSDPATKAVMEACIAENEADKHASNLKGISVLARIGSNDRTVHPFFVRRMVRVLKSWGVNVSYTELPGKEHWWWDTVDTNDGGAVNDKQLRDFMNAHSSLPALDKQRCDAEDGTCDNAHSKYKKDENKVDDFVLTVVNPAFTGSMRGIKVLQQVIPMSTSSVKVTLDAHNVNLFTVNVNKLLISDDLTRIRPVMWNKKQITIDDKLVIQPGKYSELCVCFQSDAWSVCDTCTEEASPSSRNLQTLGPARRVAEAPFLIVTGTAAAAAETQVLQSYAVYIANLFYLTSDTAAHIIKDVDLTAEIAEKHNLIIIGSPSQNTHTQQYLERISIENTLSGIKLGRCLFKEPQTGVLYLAPHNGGKSLALILMANSMQGLWDIVSLATPTIPPMTRSPFSNLIPDYVLTGPEYRSRGSGGYLCTGFWSNSWNGRPELSSCGHCWL